MKKNASLKHLNPGELKIFVSRKVKQVEHWCFSAIYNWHLSFLSSWEIGTRYWSELTKLWNLVPEFGVSHLKELGQLKICLPWNMWIKMNVILTWFSWFKKAIKRYLNYSYKFAITEWTKIFNFSPFSF